MYIIDDFHACTCLVDFNPNGSFWFVENPTFCHTYNSTVIRKLWLTRWRPDAFLADFFTSTLETYSIRADLIIDSYHFWRPPLIHLLTSTCYKTLFPIVIFPLFLNVQDLIGFYQHLSKSTMEYSIRIVLIPYRTWF